MNDTHGEKKKLTCKFLHTHQPGKVFQWTHHLKMPGALLFPEILTESSHLQGRLGCDFASGKLRKGVLSTKKLSLFFVLTI